MIKKYLFLALKFLLLQFLSILIIVICVEVKKNAITTEFLIEFFTDLLYCPKYIYAIFIINSLIGTVGFYIFKFDKMFINFKILKFLFVTFIIFEADYFLNSLVHKKNRSDNWSDFFINFITFNYSGAWLGDLFIVLFLWGNSVLCFIILCFFQRYKKRHSQ